MRYNPDALRTGASGIVTSIENVSARCNSTRSANSFESFRVLAPDSYLLLTTGQAHSPEALPLGALKEPKDLFAGVQQRLH